jgi:Domain of unknown function (DUF2019)
MTKSDFAKMTSEKLKETFIDRARQARCCMNHSAPPQIDTPEIKGFKQEVAEIGAELTKRGSVAHAHLLMDHDDKNVRAWASIRLGALDKEWADAVRTSLQRDVPTRTVVAHRERVRRGTPPGPSLRAASVVQLTARFEDAGLRKYGTQFMPAEDDPRNVILRNSITGEMIDIANELARRGAQAALLPFLRHHNVGVKVGAAETLLDFAPDCAAAALKEIVAGPDYIESVDAFGILERWRFDRKKRSAVK